MPRISIKDRGFTLLEIMAALVIVAIITVFAISSIVSAQLTARDGQRRSDLKLIQGALQSYYADNNFFPGDNEVVFGSALKSRDPSPNTKTYISALPNDPTSSPNYCYRSMVSRSTDTSCSSSSGICQYYRLCAKLENPDPAEIASPFCTCGTVTNYNYQVTPP